jgi:putative hydrolase of the HAD superfamily
VGVLRAALFDLDGVLRHHDPDHAGRVEAEHGLAPGTLGRAAFEVARLEAAVSGALTHEAWTRAVADELTATHGVEGPTVAAAYFAIEAATVDEDVLALVREVRRRVPVGLLTNGSSRLPEELAVSGLASEIDVVCNSWDLGVAKPNRVAYELAAARMEATPAQCFFTDDRPANVDAARAVGMTAHLHLGTAELRGALRSARLVD